MHTDVACIPVTYATNNTLNLPDVAAAADAALRTVHRRQALMVDANHALFVYTVAIRIDCANLDEPVSGKL